MTMISVSDLVKYHGSACVLAGINLEVAQGEVAVIIGPSGGGKSTFLRCLNGLERFDGGRVTIDGLDLDASSPESVRQATLAQVRRRVGMVFQQFHLFPHQTVLEPAATGGHCPGTGHASRGDLV